MKTIIAGSRTFKDYSTLEKICNTKHITKVLCGRAKGADTLGENYADFNNIHIEFFPADWDRYSNRAGYIRNEEMAKNAEQLILFWDGESKGSKHMLDLALKYKLFITVYNYKDNTIKMYNLVRD